MKNKIFYVSFIIAVITAVLNIFSYPYLPEKVPMHWGLNGEVNRYGSKMELIFIGILPLIIVLMQKFLPRIDPKKDSYKMHSNAYSNISLIIVIFMSVLNVGIIISSTGHNIPLNNVVPILIGLLLIGIGNYTAQLRHNYFLGFRTPWALASEHVWRKTQRFGGYVFVVIGIIPLLSLIIGTLAIKLFFVALIVGIAAIYLYSYQTFKKGV